MTYCSVIRNFAKFDIVQAEKLREQLSLSMPAEMLQFCGKYYKTQIKRDPFADELQMLDKLVSLRESIGVSLAIAEFSTNDAFVARTYADMLKKRKQLFPNSVHPMTLGEAINFANEFICHAKRIDARNNPFSSIENIKDIVSYPDASCVTAPGSAYRMRLLPHPQTEVTSGDMLVLISPAANDTPTAFYRKVSALLQNQELMQNVKSVSCVGNGGILRTLLSMTDGAVIQLSALSPIGTSIPATALCDGFFGCRILRVAPPQWNIVAALLAKCNVRSILFASVKSEPQFVFARDAQSSFALDTRFLRSLNRYTKGGAKLADEFALSPTPIAFEGIDGGKCANSVASYAQLESAPYQTALWSVLAPIASLCANGVPYSKQILSLAWEFPADLSDSATVGKCLAGILGIYRVQTELGLFASRDVPLRADKDLKSPSVSVWITAQETSPLPCIFTKEESLVYAFTPKLDKDGLPDFFVLRQAFTQLAKLAEEGKILSCCPLVGESITDGIRKMSDTFTWNLRDRAVASEGALPFCLLIESEHALPWRNVGLVRPWKQVESADKFHP